MAESSFDYTPYHYGYNNPAYWNDPTGLLSDSFIASIWNNSPDKKNTYWENMGGYFVGSSIYDLEYSLAVFYSGAVEETLPMLYMEASRGGGGYLNFASAWNYGFGEMVRDHTYRNSKYYKHYRDAMWGKKWDDFQSGLDVLGTFDPTGIIDGLNAVGYLGRGQYANAAIAGIAIIPYIGDVGKSGKYLNKFSTAYKEASGTLKYAAESIPNSAYTYTTKNGTPISKHFYNDQGKMIFEINYKPHNMGGVHGHNLSIPGSISSGHLPENHIPFMLIPKQFL